DDKKKESTTDFALWKKTNEGIQFDTPWSKGRPGWHTECVVMINKLFKDGKIDIHGGGQDLKFPHHENEIAQSMAYNGHPIANYWMHNQMINIDGEKMSKSLGNVLWAKDLIVEFGCNVFKWLMLSTHYRNPLNMTDDVIAGVRKEVSKVENATKNASLYLQVNHVPAHDYKKETVDAMVNALEDDLNTSLALTQVLDQVKVLNQVMRVREKDNDVIATEYATLVKMGDVLGFLFEGTKLSEEDIALYEQWNAYKKEKNFDEADRVRKELTERGIL
ncbi:MAG TPA: cysteine--tRNA ligase, partial [Catenibacterium sp.]|nr:cysteine--tRNA ligase [Catenibacterium sp.]